MKYFILTALFIQLGLVSNVTFAVAWTAEIENVRVWDTNKAEIFLKNPRNSNPSGQTWNCGSNIVLIGNPVAPSLLSLALSSWVANKTVRLNVTGSGAGCRTNYIQTTTTL